MKTNDTEEVRVMINTKSLCDLALYLSGLKDGKGNLLPLGTNVLDDLWNVVSYLRGDVKYIAERDQMM